MSFRGFYLLFDGYIVVFKVRVVVVGWIKVTHHKFRLEVSIEMTFASCWSNVMSRLTLFIQYRAPT